MRVIDARNVNDAYRTGVTLLRTHGARESSRAGEVLVVDGPVTTVYHSPTERVLFDEGRDANPFFHLFESLWMLSGSDDATYLNKFVRDFGERFAEPGTSTLHGAYGNRWRYFFDDDQLDAVVHRLRRDPTDRRSVVGMWDPMADLFGPDDVNEEGNATWTDAPEPRDLPCNTHVYLRVRRNDSPYAGMKLVDGLIPDQVLDLTVLCRSNDIVWGAYGANAVHFSVLLEYLAARIGVGVGKMYQVSNNWHGYTAVLDKVGAPEGSSPYSDGLATPQPMVTVPHEFDADVRRFMNSPYDAVYANTWFFETAVPMLWAHENWRAGDSNSAFVMAGKIRATDWRLAVQRWLDRRVKR